MKPPSAVGSISVRSDESGSWSRLQLDETHYPGEELVDAEWLLQYVAAKSRTSRDLVFVETSGHDQDGQPVPSGISPNEVKEFPPGGTREMDIDDRRIEVLAWNSQ